MKLIDLSVRDFTREVDSASPAPGGGSVSALSATLGMALLRMVGHLSISKKKFKQLDDSIQTAFFDIHDSLKGLQTRLLELIDKDTEAFNAIMDALRLPKDSDFDIKKRDKALENATLKAIEIPLNIAETAMIALKKVDFIASYGNKNALSDVGVSALMLYAGLEGACLNVKINLLSITNETKKSEYLKKINTLIKEGKKIKDTVLDSIHQEL